MSFDPRMQDRPQRRTDGDVLSLAAMATMSLIHVLAALSFMIVLVVATSQARAEDAGANCAGTDLVAAMAQKDPERLAEIRAQAAEIPNGDSRFWRVEKDGVSPSWLFGTMHVTDPRVHAIPEPVTKAFDAARVVVIETTGILDETQMAATVLSRPDLTMFTDGTTLESHLTDEELETVKAELDERGVALPLVSHMKPWMIMSIVAMPDCELEQKAAGAKFLDEMLANRAVEDGKEVAGLEELSEQLEAMGGLADDLQVRWLLETLALGDRLNDMFATMTSLYLDGQIGMIMPLLQSISPELDGDDGSDYAAFEERIIDLRNVVMAERSQSYLDQGNAFIAVGALHLPGKAGVVARLRDAGYRVTAVR